MTKTANLPFEQYKEWHTLPAPFYTSKQALELDKEFFYNNWFYAANVVDVKEPGQYYVVRIINETILIIRDHDMKIRAFFNTCCHRAAELTRDERGTCSNIVCPYHQWTYNLKGNLIQAGQTDSNFDLGKYALKEVKVENIGGLLFLYLGNNPCASIEKVKELVLPYIKPYKMHEMKIAFQQDIIEDTNWKLVLENNRECYHCSGSHPELLESLFAYGFGFDYSSDVEAMNEEEKYFHNLNKEKVREWESIGLKYEPVNFPNDLWLRINRSPLNKGAYSFTMDGKLACKKLLAPFKKPEGSDLSIWFNPNCWHHFMCDHIITFRVLPSTDPGKAILRTTWLVASDAVEGVDYTEKQLCHVWTETNKQDRALAESAYRGVNSIGYKPGPYLESTESYVFQFTNWYMRRVADIAEKKLLPANDQNASKEVRQGVVWNGDLCKLRCTSVVEENANVKTFTFAPTKPSIFEYTPGQFITLRLNIDGNFINRSYTISSAPLNKDSITITTKRDENGGIVSNWMHDSFKEGMEIDALGPSGAFSFFNNDTRSKLLLCSGGIGITPMMSMARYILYNDIDVDVHFLHSNRSVADFVFYDELRNMERQHSNFTLTLICDSDVGWKGRIGFINKDTLVEIEPDFMRSAVYCCGPAPYMDNLENILRSVDFDMAHFHQESFNFIEMMKSEFDITEKKQPSTLKPHTITLAQKNKTVVGDNNTSLLDSFHKNGINVPSSCKSGLCGTCRIKLISGDVTMHDNGGLLKRDKDNGYILACCSYPKSDVHVDM